MDIFKYICGIILFFAIIIIIRRPPFSQIPVLLYHSVSDNVLDEKLTLDIRTFKKQMSVIRILRYKPITIEEYIQSRLKKRYSKCQELLISFDDGYEDNFLNAYPVLLRNEFPAVIFLVTDIIGKRASWLEKHSHLDRKKMLTWEQIKKMQENKISFCSHGTNHRNLTALDRTTLVSELARSKNLLEKKLRVEVKAIAYPLSLHNRSVIEVVQECGYLIGFAVDTGDGTCFRLNRTKCSGNDSLFVFFLKISGWYNFLLKVKKNIRLTHANRKK